MGCSIKALKQERDSADEEGELKTNRRRERKAVHKMGDSSSGKTEEAAAGEQVVDRPSQHGT